MINRKWLVLGEAANEDSTILEQQRRLLPVERESVTASAKRFVLHDQARSTLNKAENSGAPPPIRERRNPTATHSKISLRIGLTAQQVDALATLELFKWDLRFVRRPMFQPPIPIVFSPDESRFIVIEDDGTINENPGFKLRP